jgi:hypothetical protein
MGKDITNRQLLKALNLRFDTLEEMVVAIGGTLADVVDDMAIRRDLEELRKELKIDMSDLELRLGRRIDDALAARTAR